MVTFINTETIIDAVEMKHIGKINYFKTPENTSKRKGHLLVIIKIDRIWQEPVNVSTSLHPTTLVNLFVWPHTVRVALVMKWPM